LSNQRYNKTTNAKSSVYNQCALRGEGSITFVREALSNS
jgi:hypothetical protein